MTPYIKEFLEVTRVKETYLSPYQADFFSYTLLCYGAGVFNNEVQHRF